MGLTIKDFGSVCTVTLALEIWSWVKVMTHRWVIDNTIQVRHDRSYGADIVFAYVCAVTLTLEICMVLSQGLDTPLGPFYLTVRVYRQTNGQGNSSIPPNFIAGGIKTLTPLEKSKKQSDNTKTPTKRLITQWLLTDLRQLVESAYIHPTGVVKLVYGIPTFPLIAKAAKSKGRTLNKMCK